MLTPPRRLRRRPGALYSSGQWHPAEPALPQRSRRLNLERAPCRRFASAVLGRARKAIRHARAYPSKAFKEFRATLAGLHTLRTLQQWRHPLELRQRRSSARQVSPAPLAVPRDHGYRALSPDEFPGGADLVRRCREIYETRVGGASTSERLKDHYLADLLNDDLLRGHPEFVDFALQDTILNAATTYLGTLPVLRRVGLLLSTPREARGDSMLLHRDPEDFKQIKLFSTSTTSMTATGRLRFCRPPLPPTPCAASRPERRACGDSDATRTLKCSSSASHPRPSRPRDRPAAGCSSIPAGASTTGVGCGRDTSDSSTTCSSAAITCRFARAPTGSTASDFRTTRFAGGSSLRIDARFSDEVPVWTALLPRSQPAWLLPRRALPVEHLVSKPPRTLFSDL